MNRLLDTLFGFEQGTFGQQDSGIGFQTTLPFWIWMMVVVALIALIWRSYHGLSGSTRTRITLASLRWISIMLLFVLALGPQIERRRTLVEQDRVLVLLDASGSMNTQERGSDGTTTSRAQILDQTLRDHQSVFQQIAQRSTIDAYAYSNRAMPLDTLEMDPDSITSSASTSISSALQTALNNSGTNPISGIVVFSDGRSHDAPSQALIERLLGSGVPIIGVPIGSADPIRDASITRIESPSAVFAKDRVPVRVQALAAGYSTGDEIRVELVDQSTGQVLDSTTHTIDERTAFESDLGHSFDKSGERSLLVRIVPVNQSASDLDLVADNNTQEIMLSVVSDPMRVLYIDGQPRWEYRYLKNLLMREETIDATTMLLASDRRFIEEGQPISGPIPDSLEAWEPFDVVILGDVKPDLFSESQLRSLKAHIESRGCGLLWIAGEGATPSGWSGSELAGLLPMQSGKADSASSAPLSNTPIVMQLTDEAQRVGLLAQENDTDEEEMSRVDDPASGWTLLRWSHPIASDDLKPGVVPLALAQRVDSDPADPIQSDALVTSMRYGGGQVGYVGTDEIWRWRYGRGEDLPEQFWLPLVRTLARGTILRRASPAAFEITPEVPTPGSAVRASLQLFDNALIDELPGTLQATIQPLSTRAPESQIHLTGNAQSRSALWTPDEPGSYSFSITHPLIGPDPLTRVVQVRASWDETLNPNTDHDALERISNQTGGTLLDPASLSELPDILPNRTRITTLDPETTSLWDRPIVLIMLVLLLSIEWIGRRILRLA
ncbi:MAG: hypothetical protein JJ974_01710 [Phycisphaerales bacterium]|nr:hypothetical protein [Phycisphaerales bacterium]